MRLGPAYETAIAAQIAVKGHTKPVESVDCVVLMTPAAALEWRRWRYDVYASVGNPMADHTPPRWLAAIVNLLHGKRYATQIADTLPADTIVLLEAL